MPNQLLLLRHMSQTSSANTKAMAGGHGMQATLSEPHNESVSAQVARFEVGSQSCIVLCVDDMLPRHTVKRPGARPQLIYMEGEVGHFELCGHRYAIVRCEHEGADGPHQGRDEQSPAVDIRELLTNRELQIVQLISMGCVTKQVSHRLRISEFTVRSYLKTIYCKLGVHSRGAMVYRYAQSFRRPIEAEPMRLGRLP
jgi:DNA-binding CsgD family transcriptional regulator